MPANVSNILATDWRCACGRWNCLTVIKLSYGEYESIYSTCHYRPSIFRHIWSYAYTSKRTTCFILDISNIEEQEQTVSKILFSLILCLILIDCDSF